MKILIQDIPQGCISSENFLIGVVVHYKGNKIDLEINDQKLAERILLEEKAKRLLWKEQMLKQLESEKEFDKQALKIGDKIKQSVWERLKREGW